VLVGSKPSGASAVSIPSALSAFISAVPVTSSAAAGTEDIGISVIIISTQSIRLIRLLKIFVIIFLLFENIVDKNTNTIKTRFFGCASE
jgi:hypothetical protein